MAFKLYEFDNEKDSNIALSKKIISLIKEEVISKNYVNISFSGGKSPINLFEILNKENIEWEKCNISLVDERIVDLNSLDSNTNLLKKYLFQNFAKKSNFIPLLEDETLKTDILVKKSNSLFKQPDIAILGMGLDGHTASIFPEAQEFEFALNTNDNIILTTPKNAPYKRLSMSLFALENCKKLFLSISGKEKKIVFNEALKSINKKFPISYILHSRKVECHVYISE